MLYSEFQGLKLSKLGFGAMRLPVLADNSIDEKQVEEMVAYAMAHGVNYFDTAYPYHSSMSEIVLGRILNRYPRDSWFLATKYPGHQVAESYDPAAVFEDQLRKCGVDYFDFYLLHNVYESSIGVYTDPKWGIIDYFLEQKRLGRIRHLGFSTHAQPDVLRAFLDEYGSDFEFCQIQLNWLDWTLQGAKAKVEMLNERNIPIWVMEPVRGGRLCSLSEADEAALKALRPEESIPSWGFRFLQDIPGVSVILSGMSSTEQMIANVATFESAKPLSAEETQKLMDIAEGMKDSVPCTGCRYCTDHCPQGLNIPWLLNAYNEIHFMPTTNAAMRLECLPAEQLPSACIGCGACAAICPQRIDIPSCMADLSERLKTIPKWIDICRERAEAAKRASSN